MRRTSLVLTAIVSVSCGGDDSAASSSGSPTDGGGAVDTGSSEQDGGSSGNVDAGLPNDAGGDGANTPNDDAFACTPVVAAPGPDPTYEVAGAMPAPQGGTLLLGTYRTVKGTHAYVETNPGDCNGVTPPPVTPYRTELELRPTHYLFRIMTTNFSGTWTTSGNAFKTTQSCPDAKSESGIGYTANGGSTFTLYGTKQDYLSGGCHFYMLYEMQKQ